MNEAKQAQGSEIPPWVVAVVLLVSLAAAGWFIIQGGVQAPPKPSVGPGPVSVGPATRPLDPAKPYVVPDPVNWKEDLFTLSKPDGITQTGANSWSVKSGRIFMQAYRKEDGNLSARLVYPFGEM